jgi:hypothetical protein
MAGMIVNARAPLDDRRHAGQCPQIGSETVGLRALPQSLVHLLELCPSSFGRRPARPAPRIQSGLSCRHASNHWLTL